MATVQNEIENILNRMAIRRLNSEFDHNDPVEVTDCRRLCEILLEHLAEYPFSIKIYANIHDDDPVEEPDWFHENMMKFYDTFIFHGHCNNLEVKIHFLPRCSQEKVLQLIRRSSKIIFGGDSFWNLHAFEKKREDLITEMQQAWKNKM